MGPSWAITDEDEGYPKLLFDAIDKRLLKNKTLNFRSFVMLALVHEVRYDEFVCPRDSAYIVETRTVTSEEPPKVALPRLSGSPAFTLSNDPAKLVAPQLCGVAPRLDASARASVACATRVSAESGKGDTLLTFISQSTYVSSPDSRFGPRRKSQSHSIGS